MVSGKNSVQLKCKTVMINSGVFTTILHANGAPCEDLQFDGKISSVSSLAYLTLFFLEKLLILVLINLEK